jgi:hypothetical protein
MGQQNAVATTDEHIREVLKPILYTDIFDYPLTVEEVHRFLEFEASLEEVRSWLDQAVQMGELALRDGLYSLLLRRWWRDAESVKRPRPACGPRPLIMDAGLRLCPL